MADCKSKRFRINFAMSPKYSHSFMRGHRRSAVSVKESSFGSHSSNFSSPEASRVIGG